MSASTPARRRTPPALLATGLATTLIGAAAITTAITTAPAQAASVDVQGLQFRWGLNDESNNAAYAPGTFNFFSAGVIGNPGTGGQTLTSCDRGATWANGATAGWSASAGNVVIEKEQPDGGYAVATWAGLKTAPDGSAVTINSTTFTDHQVVINNGHGTLDPDAEDADITWDGDFTALYYSGMTYFTVSDPHLVVHDGAGEITATLGGYAADMNDPSKWSPLAATTVTLASLSGVDVTATGLQVTPDYLGVPYTAPGSATPQSPPSSANAAYWGSFPQSFVDFQQLTGSSSYWYTSGGSADLRKATLPLYVGTPEPVEQPSQPDTGTGQCDGGDPGKAASTVALSLTGPTAYGVGHTVTVTVPGATGTVTLTGAGPARTATLAAGTATVTLPASLAPGAYPLTATYGGDAGHDGATGHTTLVVTKAATRLTARVAKAPTSRKKGKATVTVAAATGAAVTGKVTVTLKKGKATKRLTGTLRGGVATLKLPKLPRGTWKAALSYPGSATLAASSGKAKVKVSR
jgi:hypothetical protein